MKFDGKEVTTMRGLPRLVAQTPIGKSVDVELLRKGQAKTVQVTVGRLEDDDNTDDQTLTESSPKALPGTAVFGLKLSRLTKELRKKYGLDAR